ncbi:hypothetical protein [Tissierella sp.]
MVVGALTGIVIILISEVNRIRKELEELKLECRLHGVKKAM